MSKPRKPIAELIEELRSWLPNYDHGPDSFPNTFWKPAGTETREAKHNLYVWQISLQVTSPDRPNLKHEIQFRVQAPSNAKAEAIDKAKELAARDGYTVVSITGAARGYMIKEQVGSPHWDDWSSQAARFSRETGADYAREQLAGAYFQDWVWEQIVEAERMRAADPSSVLPLETPADARKVARNMLQQLVWNTKRELKESKEFFEGFVDELHKPSTVEWLTEILLRWRRSLQGSVGRLDNRLRQNRPSTRSTGLAIVGPPRRRRT